MFKSVEFCLKRCNVMIPMVSAFLGVKMCFFTCFSCFFISL